MNNEYTLLQICEVWGTFKKDGEDVSYRYLKGWFAVESFNALGDTVMRFTKEYKLGPEFSAKVGAKTSGLLFDERGRLCALT